MPSDLCATMLEDAAHPGSWTLSQSGDRPVAPRPKSNWLIRHE
jgi:hypothetical protein